MKINLFQKAVLAIYGCSLIYFSIVHVPFKTSDKYEIEYDTLFSNKSNLETGRLILIILIITILTGILLLLLRNLTITPGLANSKSKSIKLSYILLPVIILLIAVFYFSYNKNSPSTSDPKSTLFDSTTTIAKDSVISISPASADSAATDPLALKRIETCNEEHTLKNFREYLKFYYPDWKIYGKPVIKEQSECTYRIQFTTKDPHLTYSVEKEIMVVEISYNEDYTRYTFRVIRGTLY